MFYRMLDLETNSFAKTQHSLKNSPFFTSFNYIFLLFIILEIMWIIFALLNPVSESFKNVFSKKASLNNADPFAISWFNNFIPVLIYTPLFFFIEIKYSIDFFAPLYVSAFINVIAVLLYHRAISKGDISLVIPMLSFSPLFLLVLSPIILDEFPTFYGLIGIILIVIGSYLINIKLAKGGLLAPIKSLFVNKGTRYMLIISFIWSISANFDKLAVNASSPLQYIIFSNIFVFLGINIVIFAKRKQKLILQAKSNKYIIIVGVFTDLSFFLHMQALSMTLVAYVIVLKRLSGLITVFFGYFFLGEGDIRDKLIGSIIMFIGVIFIFLPS